MAEACVSDQDRFICPVCLHLPTDPVTVPCGHTFCMVCIDGCWDQKDQRGVYSCPQCRETFTPRPVLRRNYFIAEMLENLKLTEPQAAPPAGSGDVECDFCSGIKLKAVKSCLTCLASFCEDHLKPHSEVPAWKKHRLVRASGQLQEKICSRHDKLIEIYCRTDQSCICYLCTVQEHKGHDTVAAAEERSQKQRKLKKMQKKFQQRLQEKEKELQELKQAVNTVTSSAQEALDDIEKIFAELICSIERKRSEVTELIRAQEKTELSRTEEQLEKVEQEIADLKRRNTELEQLSNTEDPIHFLQSFRSLCVSSGSEDSSRIAVHQDLLFDGVRKSLSDLKEKLEQFCNEEFSKVTEQRSTAAAVPVISPQKPKTRDDFLQRSTAAAVPMISLKKPKTRDDFLQYWCWLTLDPNTAHHFLVLSEENRAVTCKAGFQRHSDHPERFALTPQVLCQESLRGRCYWEVEWSRGWLGVVSISVSYKGIGREGWGDDCKFGCNDQSWTLQCSSSLTFRHNDVDTDLSAPPCSRIGVYLDHCAGTLSFYSVSHTMTLLHTVHASFTQPLYAGFLVGFGSSAKLCDPE